MEAKAKQIKIINQAHYHYHDRISLKNVESKFSEIDRKQALTERIGDYERICCVIAPLYWFVSFASGCIEKRVEINTWFLIILSLKTRSY